MFRTNPRTKPDFSVGTYQQFVPERPRSTGRVTYAVRALGRGAANIILHILTAMYESRRRQAETVLEHCGNPVLFRAGREARTSATPRRAAATQSSPASESSAGDAAYGMRIRCSITGAPCEGENAHLCIEWGCARKGGLSPILHENFS